MITRHTHAQIPADLSADDTLALAQVGACEVSVSLLFANGSGCYVGLVEQYDDWQSSRMYFLSGDTLQFSVSLPDGERTLYIAYCGTDPDSQILAGSSLTVTPTQPPPYLVDEDALTDE